MDFAFDHARDDRSQALTNWFLTILVVVLYAPTIVWLWERWTLSVWHHAHGLLILAVVVYLIWRELRQCPGRPSDTTGWGFVFLLPALALHVFDASMHTQLLSAAALFLSLPGFSLLFLGLQKTRRIIFPLCFLFFTLPIPLAFTESMHLALRHIATVSSASMLPALGIPVFAEGTTLQVPEGTLQVADACSGFSTLYASVAVAFLTAYFCVSPLRRILVLVAAVPIAIGANILRVVMLAVLVNSFGIDVLGTSLHTISGLFTFVLALPAILWLGGMWKAPGAAE